MAKPGRSGVSRVVHASRYSWLGFKAAWRHEAAFRQEALLCLMLAPLSFWVGADLLETALLLATLLIVLLAELINSAIEAVVDRIGDDPHELSGRAKDIGSAAVFVSLTLVAVVWGLVLVKNLQGLN